METDELKEELKEELEKEYLIIKKGKWWSFIGGAAMFLVVTGLISYNASLKALEKTSAKTTVKELENLKISADQQLEYVRINRSKSEELVKKMEDDLSSSQVLMEKLNEIQALISVGNEWEEYSDNIKDVLNEPRKYEYAIHRNGGFRALNYSTWNGGYRVTTDIYMTGDTNGAGTKFRLGGSTWVWGTKDPLDDKGVYHFYYTSGANGFETSSGNGLTKADTGGEGKIFRRLRK